MVKMKRKAMGRGGDLILRKGSAKYGCAEAGAKDEGLWGYKEATGEGLETSQSAQDMINQLSELDCPWS
ncbi:hypothetical protein BC943DRAFT_95515 [Umbelopsis sp. AD052]|nr:hypothetical protein BC943DRAFT_95515 [Umbelopsis sp. AD052]